MHMYMQRLAICLLVFAFVLSGCTVAPVQPAPTIDAVTATETPPEPEPGRLTIVDVRARPAPLAGGTGAVYFTVLNGLDRDVQLVSASSPVAKVVETHETVSENGVMKMIPLPDGYEIPAGEALVLKPGGKHIMLIDLVKPLQPGDEFTLTVNFDNGESFELTVPVLDMQMTMPMPDAQHDHDQDHGDAKAEDTSHDHGHGDAEMKEESRSHDHGHITHSEATMAAIQALPISAVHKLDEALHAGEAIDLNAALETVHELKEKLDATSWPEELKEVVSAIRAKVEALHAALSNNDLNAAKALAAELHDLLHQLEGHR
ncbi:MAG: copper chaperone PCu(A)C [Caldilinea sp.]|nr:copper chaperone PCu(A)C [Caldilinea sp.]MDW8440637.1 copper chaperone PCu(A)C [Caldilineaceae bacterium]